MEKVQEEWTMLRSPYDAGLEPRPSRGAMRSAALAPKVVQDLRTLAQKGYIGVDDFATGWFGSGVLPQVALALADVNGEHDACGGQRPQ
jgi:hypothetical protein